MKDLPQKKGILFLNLEKIQGKGVKVGKGENKKRKEKDLDKSISTRTIERIGIIGSIGIIEDKISIMIVIGETGKEMIEVIEVRKRIRRNRERIGIDHVQGKSTRIIDSDENIDVIIIRLIMML